MNKFTTISTKDYIPLSHKEEYFHNKYELIQSFLEKEFGEEFANILALPQIKNREVDWHSKYKTLFKRITEFTKKEQEQILNIYWEKINTIKALSSSFHNSNSDEKKRWADLLDDVFNSNNNVVFSDGENIVLLWGWKFNASEENYIPHPVISTSEKIEDHTISESIEVDNPIPVIPTDPIVPDLTDPKIPWYILFWEWIEKTFKRFWWILLLLLILWLLSNLDGCSCNKSEHIDLTQYNTTDENIEIINDNNENNELYNLDSVDNTGPLVDDNKEIINDNNTNNELNNWDPDNNNTGLEDDEFKQIIENNLPLELYENLLIEENGDPRLLPNKPQVNIPINMDELIENEQQQMIVPDRINLYLKEPNDKIEDFAIKFKEEYPSTDYQIIYRDDKMRRIQIRVPETKREEVRNNIKNNLNNNVLIWDETIFQGSNFNDPGLKDNNINYYFENINMSKSWERTTGNKDIIIAIIDDGFDLNHDELNDNIVKPYNVIFQNDRVYANSDLEHGTHVAGLAISEKNNGIGVCGIAPDCSFMPIQISSDNYPGQFSMTDIIDGVLYAINNDANVINLSIQSMYPEEAKQVTDEQLNEMLHNVSRDDELFWNELFKIANDSNITIVFAAGNCEVLIGLDAMKRDNNIITVSAVDQKNKKAEFSNYGRRSTISAPGVDIFSCKPGGQFVIQDGTSMSSPIIAGVIGLMKSVNPALTNKQLIDILQTTGIEVDGSIGPLVQVDKALNKAISLAEKEDVLVENVDEEEDNNDIIEEVENDENKEDIQEKDTTEDFYFFLLIIIAILLLLLTLRYTFFRNT